MRSKHLNSNPDVYAVIFDKDDECIEGLTFFAKEHELTACQITAIGALKRAELGYFDTSRNRYHHIPVDEQVEVLSFLGDISLKDEDHPKVHVHTVLGKSDGAAVGGHLLKGFVWPTLEVILTASPDYLMRRHDPETGLSLIDPAIESKQGARS